MKKYLSILVLASLLLMSLVSCSIEARRPYSGDLTIEVTGLPDKVKAVALFCNINDWKPDDINGSVYIQEVKGGKVSFTPDKVEGLQGYMYSEQLQCQFVPMTDPSTKLDGSWWSKAISGSSEYSNAKNNLVYEFASKGADDPMTLSLDVSANQALILVERVHYQNFKDALIRK